MARKRAQSDLDDAIRDIDEQITDVTRKLEPLTTELATPVHARKLLLDRRPVLEPKGLTGQ